MEPSKSSPCVLVKRPVSTNEGSSVSHVSHVILRNSHVIRKVTSIDSIGNEDLARNTENHVTEAANHVTSNGRSSDNVHARAQSTLYTSHVANHVTTKGVDPHTSEVVDVGEETDEDESTAGEDGISFTVDSSTTDNLLDPIEPIDFIETNPRLSQPHTSHHGVGGKRDGYRYENWSMLVNEKELEELSKKNKTPKRSKMPRGGKVDRQRPPHPLPRLTKIKSQHIHVRPSPASRKRRLSGRLARPPQLSNASEEGDMAQADEMGEGEGRDDGFVDCQEAVRKRNRKKPGGVHMLLPSGSPPSSPSNTPVSRRRTSSRKSRPKPRMRKQNKPQLASADISTQESTTQGPGSSDTSEEGMSTHEGAVLRPNEEFIDSDSEDLYEDARSLTPHLRDNPVQNNQSNSRNGSIPSHIPIMDHKHLLQRRNLDRVSDIRDPPSVMSLSSKNHVHSNSDESFAQDANETSDTDFTSLNGGFKNKKWNSRRIESDLSTAPFSSETSDMDTSGNERILRTDGRSISGAHGKGKSPRFVSSVSHQPLVEHRQLNSGSSGDEVTRTTRDVKVVPRPPPKPVLLQSGTTKTQQSQSRGPPPAKKPLHFTKSTPMGQRVHQEQASSSVTKVPGVPTRSKSGKGPSKPKPPVAVKPKLDNKPRPPITGAAPAQQRQARPLSSATKSSPELNVNRENGVVRSTNKTSLAGEATKTRPPVSPSTTRKLHAEVEVRPANRNPIRSPPLVLRRLSKLNEADREKQPPQGSLTPPVPAKPAKPTSQGTERVSLRSPVPHAQAEAGRDPSLVEASFTTSAGSEDTSKTSSSSETISSQSQSPSNSPYPSPATRKKPLPQSRFVSHVSHSKRAESNPPSLPQPHAKHVQPVLDHSQSSPVLQVTTKPPQKPPKDTEKRDAVLKTRALSSPGSTERNSPPVKPRSQSHPILQESPDGVTSPSPPPLPPRFRDSQLDLAAPSVADSQSPSPPSQRSNRRPPQSPPDNEPLPPPVPAHSNSSSTRLNKFSDSLNSNQITAIAENYEVCDLPPELSIGEYYTPEKQALSNRHSYMYTEVRDKPLPSDSNHRSMTPDGALHPKLKKKLSSSRRTPPKPPKHSTPNEATSQDMSIKEEPLSRGHSPAPPINGFAPPLPSQPIPRKKNRPTTQLPYSQSESAINNAHSSPILGEMGRNRRSVPSIVTASVSREPSKAEPPMKVYQRARRDYEEIDLLDDWEGSIHRENEEPKKPARQMRRNYEEIDILDDSPSLCSDAGSSVPRPSLSSVSSSQDPTSPIMMVAVTRQTTSSATRLDPAAIPELLLEDLRENFSTSPKLSRRRLAKSLNAKRGQSLMYKRASSDRFRQKVNTLDPSVVRNAIHRTPSLDNLNDRMDRSVRNSIHRELSSSDDEEGTVMSPTQRGLPQTPSGENLYSAPRSAASVQPERLDKAFEVNTDTAILEPLYQYINTAEFLRDSVATEGETTKSGGYVNTRGKRNQLEIARQLSQRRLWCEQPEVIQSGVLSMLSEQERKLQEAIFEVITSEATYLRSLDVLINHFMEDPGMNPNLPEGRRVMDKRQHHVIFSNVREVREVSRRFLEELQKRQRESAVVRNISDIILNYAENRFDCYVSYCTNQIYQTREMQDCLENSLMFREYLRRLELNKVCQNLNMQSFLLLPMQRITRLPLLVLAILNRTPLDHKDHHIVERTLRTVQKLVTSCNDGARKMERTEQLVEIHKKLDFGKLKPFPLVSASRQLERKGTLIGLQVEQKLLGKVKIKKAPLYVFVFTDYVIITKKKKDAKGEFYYKVVDQASRALVEVEWIETHHGVNFEKQMFGEAESVARATWAVSQAGAKHAFLLILLANAFQRCAKYIFLAQNDTDKTRWMESMERQDVEKDEEKIYQMWDCPQVQAIFDYRGQQPDELDLQRGDVVKVYRKMADGWYEGERLRDLRCGWFPSNFCAEVENEHTRARNLRETHRLMSLSISSDLVRSIAQSSK